MLVQTLLATPFYSQLPRLFISHIDVFREGIRLALVSLLDTG